ncbi:hypothetical protein SDRG_07423 [Saprolegnia diclina VS20]|uniref:Serine protease n=1 Tax=Saprolegnia diclina (strain VS20) TaxID=1156394 RepID=T0QBB5_SAPDV|nr:hypothetical protein SDRG_07423 [Saprolegnia diclina VS20]EQC35194.1 hypothetical protein SDRG_07423 [Saprolegnia diclina VS20]|eukprot:XP_008611478.1 hypothetical protein SDRG_07423 [Saprolegnia diclina VS20]
MQHHFAFRSRVRMLAASKLISTLVAGLTASVLASPQPFQIGYPVPLSLRGDHSGPFNHTIHRDGASYLSVHFTSIALPDAATLSLACADGAKQVSFTGARSEFYTESFPCNSVDVIYSAPTYDSSNHAPVFEVDQVIHGSAQSNGMLETICSISDESRPSVCSQATEPAKLAASRAVARLLINGRVTCTGWLFGSEGHMLTNSHCINSESRAANTQVEFDARCSTCKDPQNKVVSGCRGTIAAVGVKLVIWDELNDFALVKLDKLKPGVDLSTYGYLRARESGPVLGEPIWSAHHEAGWAQRLSLTYDGEVPKIADLDKASCMDNFPNARDTVGHFLDTLGGSSGAPIMSTADNVVVALHNCGLCDSVGNSNVPQGQEPSAERLYGAWHNGGTRDTGTDAGAHDSPDGRSDNGAATDECLHSCADS